MVKQPTYPQTTTSPDLPKLEEGVLARWDQENTFRASVSQFDTAPSDEGVRSEPFSGEATSHREVSQPSGGQSKKEYIFYDGPPFANGLPHYGHLLTSYVKDIFARYHTMKGEKTERRFGWDCHGLPAEMGAEKELGVSGRAAIEDYGIAKFNDYCRTSVMKYTGEWQNYIRRAGRWVDFEHDYKTMDRDYMESVLWAFQQLHEKGLVYESYRVMPYSWAAQTPLSNFETRMDDAYRERIDKAVTVAFKLKEAPQGAPKSCENYYVLAWTTTPWTLPSNLALAVKSDMEYSCIVPPSNDGTWDQPLQQARGNNCYILAKSSLDAYEKELGLEAPSAWVDVKRDEEGKSLPELTDEDQKIMDDKTQQHIETLNKIKNIRGSNLVELSYEPLFPYFADTPNAFRVLEGDFIEEGSGTGIVHLAPGFGEDDQRVCAENNIEIVCPVDDAGCYTDALFDLGDDAPLSLKGLNVIAQTEGQCKGEPYKPEQLEKYGLANLRIINWLKLKGHTKSGWIKDYKHPYPHCWRTDKPIIYRALSSWYVEVTKFKDRMVELNQNINWIPEHIKDGQFGKWLEGARDWSISRNRYWGCPIPVWRGSKGGIKVFGSIDELEAFFLEDATKEQLASWQEAGVVTPASPEPAEAARTCEGSKPSRAYHLTDLHRPYIDALTIEKDGETWERVSDVFDCWFESGSMPFAQVHYPFENKDWFEDHFPADFIVEYVGQTRGWFYTLMVLATALFDREPFKNCICHGIILAEDGKKLSKRLKNYPDPNDMFDAYGSDAVRWRMVKEPIMQGGNLLISKDGSCIRDVVRLSLKPMWNAYHFFTLYANADGITAYDLLDIAQAEAEDSVTGGACCNGAHGTGEHPLSENVLDRYILAKLKTAVRTIESSLDHYNTPDACAAFDNFFDVLNNWYIRRNRDRFWGEKGTNLDDKQAAYDTLYTVLVTMCRASAPLVPFMAEQIYGALTSSQKRTRREGSLSNPTLNLSHGEGQQAGAEDNQLILFETDRMVVRPFRIEDEPLLYDLYHSDGVKEIYPNIQTHECVTKNLQSYIDHHAQYGFSKWAIFHKETGEFMGRGGVNVLDFFFGDGDQSVERGMTLYQSYWSQGYGTELALGITDYVFSHFDLEEVVTCISVSNERSCQLQEKLGMDYVETVEQDYMGVSFTRNKYRMTKERFYTLNTNTPYFVTPAPRRSLGRQNDDVRNSVHLTAFPDVSQIPLESALVAAMDTVQQICTTAFAIRDSENIRTRQPLAALTIYAERADALAPYTEIIQDELNVKEVVLSSELDANAQLKAQVNFPVAGKRLGKAMGAVSGAVKAGNWTDNGDGTIEAGGETLTADEFSIALEPKDPKGAAATPTNDALVVLDLEVTDTLAAEGLARDVVRMIQQARKEADLHVTDRITLTLSASPDFVAAVQAHAEYITSQVLATSLTIGDASLHHRAAEQIGGEEVVISFSVNQEAAA